MTAIFPRGYSNEQPPQEQHRFGWRDGAFIASIAVTVGSMVALLTEVDGVGSHTPTTPRELLVTFVETGVAIGAVLLGDRFSRTPPGQSDQEER